LLYPFESIDTIAVNYGVVPKNISAEFDFDFTQSEDNELVSDMTITWNKALNENSIYHSAIAVQAADNAEGSLTFIPMKITRGANTVSINASQTSAIVGDVVDMSVVVQANKSGSDRAISLTALLSEGLVIVPDSMNDVEGLVMTENGFTINTSQANSAEWATNYVVSTNETNEMCRTPWQAYIPETEGKYVDLRNYGIQPSWGSFLDDSGWWPEWVHELIIPVMTDTGSNMTPFDNESYFKTNQMVLSSRGWVQLDIGNYNPWDIVPQQVHLELPSTGYSTPPDYLFAPFWNATQDINWNQSMTLAKYELNSWDAELESGVSMAYLGNYVLLEWDNAKTHDKGQDMNWNTTFEPRDDSYDHQMFMRSNTSHVPGDFEVIMAYKNVDFGSQDGSGSIGLRGYNGPRAGMWPLNGHTGVSVAYNNLDEVVKDDLIVCYDIESSESTRITVNFQAKVTGDSIASSQMLNITGSVDGVSDASAQAKISVASNINIAAIDDQSIDENTSLEELYVHFTDADGGISANTITVTGENITTAVNEHASGSSITITPDSDWHGETMVTVTVRDNVFANDLAATSFMLTVVSDGVEPVSPEIPDEPKANDPEVPSEPEAPEPTLPEEPIETPPEETGGSMNWMLLILVLLVATRNKELLLRKC